MLSVGVTGHRVLTDLHRISLGIDEAWRRITRTQPQGRVTIWCSLAEGADRLAAHRLMENAGARLVVPLPLPRSEYEKDSATPESLTEFRRLLDRADEVIELPAAPTRNQAYEAAGLYILDHCDVLIAIWDGQGAQGQGGTAEIVAGARALKLPIAWVHAGNRKPGTNEPTSLGAEQGKVTFENF
jgi:hypothetical protein